MANQPKEQATDNNKPNQETSALNELYQKLDSEQDKIIQRWANWSSSKVVGGLTLSVSYCMVAIFFMLIFALSSFLDEQYGHTKLLLLFSLLTVCNLIYLLLKKNERISNALVVLLFGVLCIYLFLTGGVEQTGPLWYFVYPVTALFILNLWEGLLMTVLLFWATMMIYSFQIVHLDYSLYSGNFIARFFSVYIAISVMSFFYAYNRSKNDLMQSKE